MNKDFDNNKSGIYINDDGDKFYYKVFADDREREILERVISKDPDITVPVIIILDRGFIMEYYDNIQIETKDIVLQKIFLLERLHRLNIFHNDLGNHNFLIKNGIVKIIDFGSSFLVDDNEWMEVLNESTLINDGITFISGKEALGFELLKLKHINSYTDMFEF